MSSRPHLVVKDNSKRIFETLKNLTKKQVFVGIPQDSAAGRVQILAKLASSSVTAPRPDFTINGTSFSGTVRLKINKRKFNKLAAAAANALDSDVSNAELLHIQSKGSVLKGIPARPVLEPAVEASGNKEAIANELGAAAKAALDGNQSLAETKLKRAGMAAQRAAQKWFTDPRNAWAPNAPSTIAAKGSDRPNIDTGGMRKAITYVVKDSE